VETTALLDAGADVDIANSLGTNPLSCAVSWQRVDLVRILLKAHASLSNKDDDGWTVLHWAVSKGLKSPPCAPAGSGSSQYAAHSTHPREAARMR
jgi:ankyrin repeat protein